MVVGWGPDRLLLTSEPEEELLVPVVACEEAIDEKGAEATNDAASVRVLALALELGVTRPPPPAGTVVVVQYVTVVVMSAVTVVVVVLAARRSSSARLAARFRCIR